MASCIWYPSDCSIAKDTKRMPLAIDSKAKVILFKNLDSCSILNVFDAFQCNENLFNAHPQFLGFL